MGPEYLVNYDGTVYQRVRSAGPLAAIGEYQHIDLREQPYFPEEEGRRKKPQTLSEVFDVDIPGSPRSDNDISGEEIRSWALDAATRMLAGRDVETMDVLEEADVFAAYIRAGRKVPL